MGRKGDNAAYTKVVQEVIDAGAVPNLVESLQRNDDLILQFDSALMLTKIVSSTSEHTQVVIDKGAVPIFVRLIIGRNDDICEQAVGFNILIVCFLYRVFHLPPNPLPVRFSTCISSVLGCRRTFAVLCLEEASSRQPRLNVAF